jgi:regulator of protease activity HflC (stomatin/prohibitin superfamily)
MFIHTARHEFTVIHRANNYVRLLPAGTHFILDLIAPYHFTEKISALTGILQHRYAWQILHDPANKDVFDILTVPDGHIAFYWVDGLFTGILPRGVHGLFKGPRTITTQILPTTPGKPIQGIDLQPILTSMYGSPYLEVVTVPVGQIAEILFAGRSLGLFESGQYVFFKQPQPITVRTVSLRENLLDISGQDIMTQDKVTLRLNLLVTYQVTSPALAFEQDGQVGDAVYRLAQLALRASVGGRSLDALLADKESLGQELSQALASPAAELGVTVKNVGVRDIILPGEMKALFNHVLHAQKEAEANIIKRREETAAARSQANTAKLLSDTPMLLKLREMELLGQVLTGANITLVVAEGDVPQKVLSLIERKT